MRSLAAVAFAAALVLACQSTPKKQAGAPPPVVTVSPEDVGRLTSEQMAPIQRARAELDTARDAVARAELAVQEAQHEDAYARADHTRADADRQRADEEARAAQQSGDARAVAHATDLRDAATLHTQAADARLDYARRLVPARQAEVKALQAGVRRAEWQLEAAKLTALREAGNPAASKYDPAPIERRVAEAQGAEASARGTALQLDRDATAARDRWRGLVERYEARVRGLQGTG